VIVLRGMVVVAIGVVVTLERRKEIVLDENDIGSSGTDGTGWREIVSGK
jgi:hypothetical protein